MVEVIKKGIGFKTECISCGSILKFEYADIKNLKPTDLEYNRDPIWASDVQYITCPVCGTKTYVRYKREWIEHTNRLYEEKNNG